MANFFLVGGTGHIGGAVLDLLYTEHPLSTFEVLVRSEDKAKRLKTKYPRVHVVAGDLGDRDVLEEGAKRADIVINAAPDITHDDGIDAILTGLTGSSRGRKGYYIHTSGASCIYEDAEPGKEPRVWDDIADIDELLLLGPDKTHVVTDNAVRAVSSKVNVAIISPPGVAGVSPSLEHPFPLATGVYIFTTRAFDSGFEVNHGINRMSEVDVLDLARAYLILVNNAVEALQNGTNVPSEPAGFPLWGRQAYYWAVGQIVPFHDRMSELVPSLHKLGVISSEEIKTMSQLDLVRTIVSGGKEYDPDAPLPPADSWMLHLGVGLSSHMCVRSSRMEKLGWRPEKKQCGEKEWESIFRGYLSLQKKQELLN